MVSLTTTWKIAFQSIRVGARTLPRVHDWLSSMSKQKSIAAYPKVKVEGKKKSGKTQNIYFSEYAI